MGMVLAATTASAAVLLGRGGAAGALTCAPHPDGSPQAVAAGREVLAGGGRFFDRYDVAIVGTVTRIETVDTSGPDHGATTVTVDVAAVLGSDTVPVTLALSSPDPGWLAGHPFEEGVDYFVPVSAEGPEGQPNFTFLCDPIAELPDVTATTAELGTLAAGAGVPFALVDSTPATAEGRDGDRGHRRHEGDDRGERPGAAAMVGHGPDTAAGRGSDLTTPAAAVAAGLGGSVTAAGMLRRRRRAR